MPVHPERLAGKACAITGPAGAIGEAAAGQLKRKERRWPGYTPPDLFIISPSQPRQPCHPRPIHPVQYRQQTPRTTVR